MLVQYSENIFDDLGPTDGGWRCQVNVMHLFLESLKSN